MTLAPHRDDPAWKDHDEARTRRLAEEAKREKAAGKTGDGKDGKDQK